MTDRRSTVLIIYLTFFVISFLTNILGPIIPDIISGFHVSLTLAAVLPFSFFIAYGFLSVPAGFLVERLGEKGAVLKARIQTLPGQQAPVGRELNLRVKSLFDQAGIEFPKPS